jgi:hypothetical protein
MVTNDDPVRCQGRPVAARLGDREDMLCASMAKTTVTFHGRQVPVCWMHRKTWDRWAGDAEANAEQVWKWSRLPQELGGIGEIQAFA